MTKQDENPFQSPAAESQSLQDNGPVFRSSNREAYRYAVSTLGFFLLFLITLLMRFADPRNQAVGFAGGSNVIFVQLVSVCICAFFAWRTIAELRRRSLTVTHEGIEGIVAPVEVVGDDFISFNPRAIKEKPSSWAYCRWKRISKVELSPRGLLVMDVLDVSQLYQVNQLSRDEYSALEEVLNHYKQQWNLG